MFLLILHPNLSKAILSVSMYVVTMGEVSLAAIESSEGHNMAASFTSGKT